MLHRAFDNGPGEILLEGKAAVRPGTLIGAQDRVVHLDQSLVRRVALGHRHDGLELFAKALEGTGAVLGLAAAFPVMQKAVVSAHRLRPRSAGLQAPLQGLDIFVDFLHLVGDVVQPVEIVSGHQGARLVRQGPLLCPQFRDFFHEVHAVTCLSKFSSLQAPGFLPGRVLPVPSVPRSPAPPLYGPGISAA